MWEVEFYNSFLKLPLHNAMTESNRQAITDLTLLFLAEETTKFRPL